MEGVNTFVPVAMTAGKVIQSALPLLAQGDRQAGVDEAAEARAQAVEAQARRRADAEWRNTQDQADALREKGEKSRARARVGAAASGLTLSGTSLLSLENQQAQADSAVDELLGDSALRIDDLLAGAGEQARSIRLSGRTPRGRSGGSLLSLGSFGLGAGGLSASPRD